MSTIFVNQFGLENARSEYFAIMCFFIFTLMSFIRRLEIFAKYLILADFIVFFTLIVVIIYAFIQIKDSKQ